MRRRHRRHRHKEEDLGFFSSLASAALGAGERIAADAAKKEIARRLGEEDLSLWDMVKSGASALAHEAAPVVGAALRDEISRDVGE